MVCVKAVAKSLASSQSAQLAMRLVLRLAAACYRTTSTLNRTPSCTSFHSLPLQVRSLSPSSSEASVLQPDDIILAIGAPCCVSAFRMPTGLLLGTLSMQQFAMLSALPQPAFALRLAFRAPHL